LLITNSDGKEYDFTCGLLDVLLRLNPGSYMYYAYISTQGGSFMLKNRSPHVV